MKVYELLNKKQKIGKENEKKKWKKKNICVSKTNGYGSTKMLSELT